MDSRSWNSPLKEAAAQSAWALEVSTGFEVTDCFNPYLSRSVWLKDPSPIPYWNQEVALHLAGTVSESEIGTHL